MFGKSFLKGSNAFLTMLTFLQRAGLLSRPFLLEKHYRKNTALEPVEPSPLDSTLAFQQGLRRGRWAVSPEIRKCHHLEISHRFGSSGFGHIKVGVVEGDMPGMCLQKLIYYIHRFSRPSETGKGGTHRRAGNHIYVPSILFEESLNVRDFISRRIHPKATGLCILARARARSFFGGSLHRGPPSLHHAQKGSLACVFAVLLPGVLVLIRAMLLWAGISRNVVVVGILRPSGVQIISKFGLQFLQVESRKKYVSVPFQVENTI